MLIMTLLSIGLVVKADMIRSSGEGGVVVISGSRALVLDCNITDGSALIAAQWFKTGEALQQRTALSNSQRVQVESGRVIIEPASEQDAGNYTCSLTVGSAGTTPVERVISVVTNASARINVRSIDVIEAEDLLVTCAVYGKPTPRVSWTKDGENVETAVHNASERVMLSSWTGAGVVVPDAVLSVAMVQRNTGDRGLYCCLASNAANTARQCVMVRVRARYACVWPLAGIVIEALLLAAIIYGCDRHSTSSAASGDDKNSAKGEIRQRK